MPPAARPARDHGQLLEQRRYQRGPGRSIDDRVQKAVAEAIAKIDG